MAIGTNKFLKFTLRKETVFGDTKDASGDVSDGVLLRPLADIPLDQFTKEAIGDTAIRREYNDAGLPAIQGLSTCVLPVELRLSGNTRSEAAALTEDGMSKVLDWLAGDRHHPGDDLVEADSTVTLIKAAAHQYVKDDVVMIGTEAALVVSKNAGDFTITPPLSAIPAAGTAIVGLESFAVTEDTVHDTVGAGVTREGDAEWQWTACGGIAKSITLGELTPGQQPSIKFDLAFADHQAEAVTHSATEIPNVAQVIGAVGASRYALTQAAGTVLVPDLATASVGLGAENEHAPGINPDAVGGKVGVISSPMDGEVGTIKVLQDDIVGTTAILNALIDHDFSQIIQIGDELGKIIGVVYENCTYTKFPTAASQGNAKAVEFGFKAGVGHIFRG